MRRIVVVPAVLVALALAAAGVATAEGPKLSGSVGPGFIISLLDAQGNRVTQLAPGPYELEVDDLSDEHNFHLTGPGIDQRTEVPAIGKTTWQLTLQNGTYTFVCDPHALQMRGSFQVGDSALRRRRHRRLRQRLLLRQRRRPRLHRALGTGRSEARACRRARVHDLAEDARRQGRHAAAAGRLHLPRARQVEDAQRAPAGRRRERARRPFPSWGRARGA